MTWPSTFAASDALTAAEMDAILVLGNAWTADSRSASTIWQGATTNPAIGNGTLTSRYMNAGKLLVWRVEITMGSTTTFGSGTWRLVPPFTLKSANATMTGTASDTSTGDNYPAWGKGNSTTLLSALCLTGTDAKFASVAATQPFTWASTDVLALHGILELA